MKTEPRLPTICVSPSVVGATFAIDWDEEDDYCYGHGAVRSRPEESIEELHARMMERWRAQREAGEDD